MKQYSKVLHVRQLFLDFLKVSELVVQMYRTSTKWRINLLFCLFIF